MTLMAVMATRGFLTCLSLPKGFWSSWGLRRIIWGPIGSFPIRQNCVDCSLSVHYVVRLQLAQGLAIRPISSMIVIRMLFAVTRLSGVVFPTATLTQLSRIRICWYRAHASGVL